MNKIKETARTVPGVILKSTGGIYGVETEDGMVNCKARGIFRKDGITPYVGDRVEIIRVAGSSGGTDKGGSLGGADKSGDLGGTDKSGGLGGTDKNGDLSSADKSGVGSADESGVTDGADDVSYSADCADRNDNDINVEKSNTADASGAVIVEIHPRDNEIVRPPVANIDYIVLVIAAIDPAPNLEVLDKFLAVAEYKRIKSLICVTKTDLTDGSVSDNIKNTYKNVADVFVIDYADTSDDSDMLRLLNKLAGKKAVLSGNTGVGKSTLLNHLDPDIGAKVGEISRKLGRGKHTTRTVQYYKLKNGAYIADTPGFGVFDTRRYDYIYKTDLVNCFPDFVPFIHKCRFHGCTHTKELGCAVIEAVRAGQIPQSRFDNYLRMYQEASALRPWNQPL